MVTRKSLHNLRTYFNHPLVKKYPIFFFSHLIIYIICRLSTKNFVIKNWFNELKIKFIHDESSSTFAYIYGHPEFNDVSFMLHILKANDTFIDVGANIGTYSLLALSINQCSVHAFEPNANSRKLLSENLSLNLGQHPLIIHSEALSNYNGTANFTSELKTKNYLLRDKPEQLQYELVQVRKLDSFIFESPTLLKIDVEGSELEVLEGALKTIKNKNLLGIIIEMVHNDQNSHDKDILFFLHNEGFYPISYEPFSRKITKLSSINNQTANTIFIRSAELINKRILQAESFKIFDKVI